nr:hypothetical protein [Tanacetum cinerariifolium]
MAPLTFADTHNMVVFLSKSDASVGFDQIVDFLNAQVIQYALTVNPTIYVLCIKQFWATASINKWKFLIHTLVQCISAKRTAWNEFSCSMTSDVIWLATVMINNQINDLSSHTTKYTSHAPTQKVFANMRRVRNGFSRMETPLFASMLVQPQAAEEEEDDVEVPAAPTLPSPTNAPSLPLQDPITSPPQAQPVTPQATPPQEHPTDPSESFMTFLNSLMEKLHDEEVEQAAAREKKEKDDLEKAKVLQQQYDEKQENIDWNVVAEQIHEKDLDNIKKYQSLKRKPISVAQARKNMIIYLKNMAGYKIEHFKGMTYDKVRPIFEREYNKVQTLFILDKDVEEPSKKRVIEETLLQESFKKLNAVEVLGSKSTQETPTNDPKEISEEDVKNMLEIVPVFEFKVKVLQVKYPLIDYDVFWKLQRFMHDPLTWKLYTNCGVHHVSSTKRLDIFMLTEKNYPLSDAIMILMLSTKLQCDKDCKMARDLVMKIFMEANKPKSKSLDTSSK